MARATICITVDEPEEVEAGARWLATNRERLDYFSKNYGCACCVDLYDLEGPVQGL